MTNAEIKKVTEILDERYSIFKNFGERNEDWLYYAGCVHMIEMLGLHWERRDGKHIIYKSYYS